MFKPNQLISDTLVHENLETGLLQVDFQITLLKDGVLSVIPVTITEITGANGFYRSEFTPDDVGRWSLDIVHIGNSTRYQQSYNVLELSSEILDEDVSNHLVPGSVGDYLNKTKKYTSNAVTRDFFDQTYAVKEDDGVTDFETGISTTTERTPN